MNPDSPFRFRPVTRYRGARYGSESPENFMGYAAWLAWRFPKALVKGAITLLLAAGLSLGATACVDDTVTYTDGDTESVTDGDVEACEPNEIVCLDNQTVKLCDDGTFETVACNDYCEREFGYEYESYGCDSEQADNPCLCEYAMTDGDIADCLPQDFTCTVDGELEGCDWMHPDWSCNDYCNYFFGEDSTPYGCTGITADNVCGCHEPGAECAENALSCNDSGNLLVCEDGQWSEQNCYQTCQDSFGYDYFSMGCDVQQADNPCLCEYEMIAGEMVECEPGDLMCDENNSLYTCDNWYWESISCNDYCVENFGEDYYSNGCNVETPDNPCGCEYGIIDGEMVECEPGDMTCDDSGVLYTCDDYYWESLDCNDYCVENFGEDYYSYGCNADDATNPCMCEDSITDGVMVECEPGELLCDANGDLYTCDEYYWELTDCDDWCHASFGAQYGSSGCDAGNSGNPCLCDDTDDSGD